MSEIKINGTDRTLVANFHLMRENLQDFIKLMVPGSSRIAASKAN